MIVPSRVLLMMASSQSCTIAAIRWATSIAFLWSLMSRMIEAAPMIVPNASRTGEAVSEAGNSVPSLQTQWVSRVSMERPALILARKS